MTGGTGGCTASTKYRQVYRHLLFNRLGHEDDELDVSDFDGDLSQLQRSFSHKNTRWD